jgi:hypothetical protein
MLPCEWNREFVPSHKSETDYSEGGSLAFCAARGPFDPGYWSWNGETLARYQGRRLLTGWRGDVRLTFGPRLEAKNARRKASLTGHARAAPRGRTSQSNSLLVSPSARGKRYLVTFLEHRYEIAAEALRLPASKEFVVHSLTHVPGTRLDESGAAGSRSGDQRSMQCDGFRNVMFTRRRTL